MANSSENFMHFMAVNSRVDTKILMVDKIKIKKLSPAWVQSSSLVKVQYSKYYIIIFLVPHFSQRELPIHSITRMINFALSNN